MGKGKLFPTVECLLIDIEDVKDLENYHLAFMIAKVYSSKNISEDCILGIGVI